MFCPAMMIGFIRSSISVAPILRFTLVGLVTTAQEQGLQNTRDSSTREYTDLFLMCFLASDVIFWQTACRIDF